MAHLQPVPDTADTGEVPADAPSYGELQQKLRKEQFANEEWGKKYNGVLSQLGVMREEMHNLREVEPEHEQINEVLEFYLDFSGRKCAIDPTTDRYTNTRARLRQRCDPPFTVERLKAAIVGAPKASYFREKRERQDPKMLFRKAEFVEECERAAGQPTGHVERIVDTSPLEAVFNTLMREFGYDLVDDHHHRTTHQLEEVWGPCPLHIEAGCTLRVTESQIESPVGAAPGRSIEVACVMGCDPDEILFALRTLRGLQAVRAPVEEIASLRVEIHDLVRALRVYAMWGHDAKLIAKDRGNVARVALGMEAA